MSAASSDGLYPYDIAVQCGFQGTEAEWLESLKGPAGDPGLPEHEYAPTLWQRFQESWVMEAIAPILCFLVTGGVLLGVIFADMAGDETRRKADQAAVECLNNGGTVYEGKSSSFAGCIYPKESK